MRFTKFVLNARKRRAKKQCWSLSNILTKEITFWRKSHIVFLSCGAIFNPHTPSSTYFPIWGMMSSKGAPQNNGSSVPPLLIVSNIGKGKGTLFRAEKIHPFYLYPSVTLFDLTIGKIFSIWSGTIVGSPLNIRFFETLIVKRWAKQRILAPYRIWGGEGGGRGVERKNGTEKLQLKQLNNYYKQ